MSEQIRISDVSKYVGQTVNINCWLYNKRSSGKIRFLELRDGSTKLLPAVVVKKVCEEDAYIQIDELTQESALNITGTIKEHPKKPGVYEMDVLNATVIHKAELDYPVSHKEHGPEHLMSYRHLWLRTPKQVAIMRVRASIIRSIRNFFDDRGFVLMDAPILTPSACEGTSTLFKTEYFDNDAYLTQSGQLYAEASAMALGKVYTFGPTFRAEKSKTRKHLTEFWMIEPEIAFCELPDLMDLGEALITTIFKETLERCEQELKTLERDTEKLKVVAEGGFQRVSYDECVNKLNESGHKFEWGEDFGAPDETKISELYGSKPVFITNFPKVFKSFYFKPDPKDDRLVQGCDLIAPEGFGEIIGGSIRETDLNVLQKAIKDHNLPMEDFEWYLDLRRYGSVPHGGFGLGLERAVSWVCGLAHIRETSPYPRLINYIRP